MHQLHTVLQEAGWDAIASLVDDSFCMRRDLANSALFVLSRARDLRFRLLLVDFVF